IRGYAPRLTRFAGSGPPGGAGRIRHPTTADPAEWMTRESLMADEKPATRAARPGALALAFLLLIYGTWYLITTLAAGATATSSAYVIGCAAVLLALLVVEIAAQIRAFIRPRAAAAGQDDTAQDPIRWRILAPMLLLMIAFAYVATQVDYIIGTLVFMVA